MGVNFPRSRVILVLVLLAAASSIGWSARTTRHLAWSAVAFFPPDLARQIRLHHRRFDAGIKRGLASPPAWRAAQPGRLSEALVASANQCAQGLGRPVPLEDLVEELVGDIQDERDRPGAEVAVLGDDTFDCDGRLEIEDLEAHLGIDIERDGFETVAGLVLKLIGRIPRAQDYVRFGDYDIEILEVVKHRVTRLRFRRLAKKTTG